MSASARGAFARHVESVADVGLADRPDAPVRVNMQHFAQTFWALVGQTILPSCTRKNAAKG
jgi:hypothetical protein